MPNEHIPENIILKVKKVHWFVQFLIWGKVLHSYFKISNQNIDTLQEPIDFRVSDS